MGQPRDGDPRAAWLLLDLTRAAADGRLGVESRAFAAAFIMAQVISVGGVLVSTEMGYVIAFVIFIVLMFVRPGGIFARRA